MRPQKLSEVVGQKHLIGENKILSNLVNNKHLFSMILYGKPGIGKTTIACCIVNELGLRYRMLNATVNNKKDFDVVIEEAKMYGGMVVIMDEIHRLNKDKQDLLLPYLENGLITLIGMTTSNPYHKINPAIRSRCQIFELHPLESEEIIFALKQVEQKNRLVNIHVDEEVYSIISNMSGGDLRNAYNLLEIAYYSTNDFHITKEVLKNLNSKPVFFHDKNEDGHYDVLSAFQKSIRGSDVDAALHYLARLIEAEDLDSIYRRMTVIAYEDIGLANPSMGSKVMAAIQAAELTGLPEARIPLGDVVIELALSPKSNTGHIALDSALEDIRRGNIGNVPDHIKTNAKDYKYPHDYPNAYVVQQYLPDPLKNRKYYHPKNSSKYERMLKEVDERIWKLKQRKKKKKMLTAYQKDLSYLDQILYDFIEEWKETYGKENQLLSLVTKILEVEEYEEMFSQIEEQIREFRKGKLIEEDLNLLFRLAGFLQYEQGLESTYQELKETMPDTLPTYFELYTLAQEAGYEKGITEMERKINLLHHT